MSAPTDFVVLGGGAVVSECYLPACKDLGWLERVVVADPSERAHDTVRGGFPTVKFVQADFRDAIQTAAREGVKAAIVALPNALHEEAVDGALEAGLDVLCEKPLALSEPVCARLTAHAEATGRLLAVGMVRRLAPAVKAARQAVAAGWIGAIESVSISWGGRFAWPSDSGEYFRRENAGVLANLGVHSLDLLQHLFGTLEPVSYCDDWGGGAEANARYALRTADGAALTITVSYTTDLANEIRFRGSAGELWFDHERPQVQVREMRSGLNAVVSVEKPFVHGDWAPTLVACFAEQLASFENAVRTRQSPLATGAEATRTAALIDWAYAHHRKPLREQRRPDGLALGAGPIVVTGGTGFVGGHVLERLVADGHDDVRVLVRSHRSGANAGRFCVRRLRTDLLDPAAVRESIAGARYVLHLAYGRDGENAAQVTTTGTENIVNAAIAEGAEAVVVLSTTAHFPKNENCVDESAVYAPSSDYERQKANAEQWTLERARTSNGTRVVVLNAACVYGPAGQAFTELPARLLKSGAFCWVNDGSGVVNHVFVTNLVDAIVRAAACPAAHGERLIVCDGAMTWREFLGALLGPAADAAASYTPEELQALGRRTRPGSRDLVRAVVANPELWRVVRENPHFDKVKTAARRALPHLSRRVRTLREAPPPRPDRVESLIPPAWIADLYGPASTRVSTAKARRVLGWTPLVGTSEAFAITREWLAGVGLLEKAGS